MSSNFAQGGRVSPRSGRVRVMVRPTVEPLTLDEAKKHLLVEISDDDALITGLLTAAIDAVELATEHALIQRTIRYTLDSLCHEVIPLGWSPFVSAVDVRYLDADGVEQVLDTAIYSITASSDRLPPRLQLKPNQSWPATAQMLDCAWVTYIVGYPESSNDKGKALAAAAMKSAIRLMLGDLYENRESNLTVQTFENRAVEALIAPFRSTRI